MVAKSYLVPTLRVSQEEMAAPKPVLAALKAKVETAPVFYKNAPLALDLSDITEVRQTSSSDAHPEG
jgi:septum formation inhibitor MinC